MKIKIFFFPVAILVMLVTIIWFAWPLWREVQAKQDAVTQKQDQLSAVEMRKKFVDEKYGELARSGTAGDFLFRYIPRDPDEEYVINAVNKAAVDSGVGLAMVEVRRLDGAVTKGFYRDGTTPVSVAIPAGTSAPVIPEVVRQPLKEYVAEVTVLGSYDNTKKFLDAMYRIDRLHGVTKASLRKYEKPIGGQDIVVAAGPDGNVPVDTAAMDLILTSLSMSFAYVPDVVIPQGAAGDVFARPLDMAFVQSMQARYTAAPTLDLSGAGQANPFGGSTN